MTGMLIDGEWHQKGAWHDRTGEFVRKPTTFRAQVEDGGRFAPSNTRYHLYVALACPWAHRVLIVRALRKLESAIDISIVNPLMGSDGWTFEAGPGVVPDPNVSAAFLRDIYVAADPSFSGRVTVPILWDKQERTIVNNESREIIRMLSRAFLPLGDPSVNLCPPALQEAVDSEITANYEPVNNGVYRSGFAGSQAAYDQAVGQLFEGLERCESKLGESRFLCGDQLTEADICLFTTLIRFDLVYHTHFKCNVKRILDYPNLWGFTRDMYQTPGIAETINFDHIKNHYYMSHANVNPTRIVARGPSLDLEAPHGRG